MVRTSRRRTLLTLGGGAFALVTLRPGCVRAADPTFDEALRAITDGREPQPGRIELDLPKIAETGNSVPLTVTVESPMTPEDHVARVHLLSQGNPRPNVATFHLGPRAGRAEVGTRLRLTRTQKVIGLAELGDGSLWSDEAYIVVTLGACIDDIWTD